MRHQALTEADVAMIRRIAARLKHPSVRLIADRCYAVLHRWISTDQIRRVLGRSRSNSREASATDEEAAAVIAQLFEDRQREMAKFSEGRAAEVEPKPFRLPKPAQQARELVKMKARSW